MGPKPVKAVIHSVKTPQTVDKKRASSDKPTVLVTSAKESSEPGKAVEVSVDGDGDTIIDPAGDIVLACKDRDDGELVCFRVNSARLKTRSKYFERILGDLRFSEGATVAYARPPSDTDDSNSGTSLPRIEVVDVGRISPVKSIRPLMTDLLLLLHQNQLTSRRVPLVNLTNLAVAADRFGAADVLAEFVRNSNVVLRPKALKSSLDEVSLRQRLLIGLLLKDDELVSVHSKDLILRGSNSWSLEDPIPPSDALWWDLPRNIEEELQLRRNLVLDTIWTLIQARIAAYTSRTRQCRLGYDTSPQCDSFHLGEFIRFLNRSGVLQFSSSLALEKPAEYCKKDVTEIMSALRSCPSYQLDANHSHCGPRKQLLAGLRFVESCLNEHEIGICLECWYDRHNLQRSWSEGRRALSFDTAHASKERARGRGMVRGHSAHGSPHEEYTARTFFTADEKKWNLEAGTLSGIFQDASEVRAD